MTDRPRGRRPTTFHPGMRIGGGTLRGLILLGAFSCLAPALSGVRDAIAGPLEDFQALPADSVDARLDLIDADRAGFAAAVDSALAAGGLEADRPALSRAAEAYLETSGDSLLVWDLAFVSEADPARLGTWHRGVVADGEGFALRGEGQHPASAEAFQEAAEAYRAAGDLRREAVAWGSLGVAHWYSGDFDAVKAAYLEALEARRRLGDPVLIGRTLNGLGSANLRTGDLAAALDWYEQARRVRETLDNPADLGTTLAYIGNVQTMLGNLDQARARYLQALEVFGPDAPLRSLRPARVGLAIVHANLGEFEEAAALYRTEIETAVAQGDNRTAAVTRKNLAITLSSMGDHAAALRELLQAAETQGAEADSFELASTVNSIGSAYFSLQNYPRALESYREATSIAEQSENEGVRVEALTNTGSTFLAMGLAARGIETLESALALTRELEDPRQESNVLSLLGGAYESEERFEEALDHYRQALAIDRERGQAGTLAARHANVGNALTALGRNAEGLGELREGARLAEEAGNREALWPCYLGIADNFETAGVLDSARVYNDRAIEVLESLRSREVSEETRAAFLGRRSYIYEAQIHVLAKLHDRRGGSDLSEAAFMTAERGRARAFLDGILEGQLDLEASVDPALAEERRELERSLNTVRYRLRQAEESGGEPDSIKTWKREIRDLERSEGRLLERLRIESPAFASLDAGSSKSLADIRRDLLPGKRDVLLEYSLGDSASYLWVLTGKEIGLHRLPPRAAIEDQVHALRRGLVSPGPEGDAPYLEAAATLYDWLLRPAMKALEKAERILVVPDGALQFVPMDVLLPEALDPPSTNLSPEERGAWFARLPYALAGTELRYGPSATALAVLAANGRDHSRSSMDLLAVGDPTFILDPGDAGTAPLAPLPFTRDEVEAIGRRFPQASRTVLLGTEAQEATLTRPGFLADYRILHLATHGLVDERRPERSRLALAAPVDATTDGYLEASEIYRLELNADLVVLSACETGLGKMVQGEGVLGLPRAFLYAGASSVVVSLWSVSDRSTEALMGAFYERLTRGGFAPGHALAEARRELRRDPAAAHPFHWAPFVLIGP